jgi:hypothetical protein
MSIAPASIVSVIVCPRQWRDHLNQVGEFPCATTTNFIGRNRSTARYRRRELGAGPGRSGSGALYSTQKRAWAS